MISFVLYIHLDSGKDGQLLAQAVQKRFPNVFRQVCRDLPGLAKTLKTLVHYTDLHVYVLLAETPERLEQLQEFIDDLEDKKILLVLPDNQRSSYATGLRLRPRFITQRSKAYEDICDVLEKMIENHSRK
ncbi:MAG: hypothetical protein K9K79_01430 [Desulfohalobiaceae bacterium]|nr:hypothetical protein [Desulfohalobiaceae bacterium]